MEVPTATLPGTLKQDSNNRVSRHVRNRDSLAAIREDVRYVVSTAIARNAAVSYYNSSPLPRFTMPLHGNLELISLPPLSTIRTTGFSIEEQLII